MGSAASGQIEPSSSAKVTRGDWLAAARAALIEKGVDHVKVLVLAQTLKVSRSSFYWYFRDRGDLLARLVEVWREMNTGEILRQTQRPSADIADGVLHVFECWTAASRFDPRLDFAVREWARRDSALHRVVRAADDACIDAIASLFRRHGYDEPDTLVRARIMYFTQVGYYALELGESEEQRLRYTAEYVRGFTGRNPHPDQIAAYRSQIRALEGLPPIADDR